jgi:4'-phosphopantetheinyl transferase
MLLDRQLHSGHNFFITRGSVTSMQSSAIHQDAFALAPDDAQLWHLAPAAIAPGQLRTKCWDLLSPDERARYDRYHFAHDRHQYLTARWLVRTLLARYTGQHPAQLSFVANAHGRPELSASACVQPLRFNLAHTRDLVVCLVALGREIGVDVEKLDAGQHGPELAATVLSPRELASFAALAPALRPRRFIELWTLKEAYVKARGLGLAIPLGQFGFELDDGATARIDIEPSLGDDSSSWEFRHVEIGSEHLACTAMRLRCGRSAQVTIRPLTVVAGDLMVLDDAREDN